MTDIIKELTEAVYNSKGNDVILVPEEKLYEYLDCLSGGPMGTRHYMDKTMFSGMPVIKTDLVTEITVL